MLLLPSYLSFFFFNDTATTEIYTLSLHDALPISGNSFCRKQSLRPWPCRCRSRSRETRPRKSAAQAEALRNRSEEHTSELQSPCNLVCRLLLEKKKKKKLRKCFHSTKRYIDDCQD